MARGWVVFTNASEPPGNRNAVSGCRGRRRRSGPASYTGTNRIGSAGLWSAPDSQRTLGAPRRRIFGCGRSLHRGRGIGVDVDLDAVRVVVVVVLVGVVVRRDDSPDGHTLLADPRHDLAQDVLVLGLVVALVAEALVPVDASAVFEGMSNVTRVVHDGLRHECHHEPEHEAVLARRRRYGCGRRCRGAARSRRPRPRCRLAVDNCIPPPGSATR